MEFLKEKNCQAELQKMECPFTWEMDEIKKTIDTDYHEHDDEEFFPLLKLMRNIMIAYVYVKENEDLETIKEVLQKCNENMKELKKKADPEISSEAAHYVLQVTKGFVYLKLKLKNELNEILKEIDDTKWPEDDKRFKSTLIACKSLAWSIYHQHGARNAETFIREAIKINPNCHLWHFILGKNLRRIRRDYHFGSSPKPDEIASLKKSYELSKNPVYGIFVAQMYRENSNYYMAAQMYQKIVETNPKSTTILLRSALGLIRLRKLDLAKICLDKVGKENSSGSMYLHYMGIYYMKKRQFKIAVNFLKKAMKDSNLPAEKEYFKCMMKINPNFDALNYLLQMVDKYKKIFPERQVQSLFLDIAFLQWKLKKQINLSSEYFLKAIKIDPTATCLTNYYCDVGLHLRCKDIYEILKTEFLPMTKGKLKHDETLKKTVDNLEKYCDDYFDRKIADDQLDVEFSKLDLK